MSSTAHTRSRSGFQSIKILGAKHRVSSYTTETYLDNIVTDAVNFAGVASRYAIACTNLRQDSSFAFLSPRRQEMDRALSSEDYLDTRTHPLSPSHYVWGCTPGNFLIQKSTLEIRTRRLLQNCEQEKDGTCPALTHVMQAWHKSHEKRNIMSENLFPSWHSQGWHRWLCGYFKNIPASLGHRWEENLQRCCCTHMSCFAKSKMQYLQFTWEERRAYYRSRPQPPPPKEVGNYLQTLSTWSSQKTKKLPKNLIKSSKNHQMRIYLCFKWRILFQMKNAALDSCMKVHQAVSNWERNLIRVAQDSSGYIATMSVQTTTLLPSTTT